MYIRHRYRYGYIYIYIYIYRDIYIYIYILYVHTGAILDILEFEGSMRQRYKRALFPYKKP